MAIERTARDGLLILGGGFAGAYVARLVGKGSTVFHRDIAELAQLGRPRGLRGG